MPGLLVGRSGTQTGRQHLLSAGITTIGRSERCDIVIPESGISRLHARVAWNGEQYVLSDNGSKNGTFLNGCRLDAPAPLRHGDIVILAGVRLAFDDSDETTDWQPEARVDGLRIDLEAAEVVVDGYPVHVTPTEYRALTFLYERRGRVVTRQDLTAHVWWQYQDPDALSARDNNIDVVIGNIRKKIERDPSKPLYIQTRRGIGYILKL